MFCLILMRWRKDVVAVVIIIVLLVLAMVVRVSAEDKTASNDVRLVDRVRRSPCVSFLLPCFASYFLPASRQHLPTEELVVMLRVKNVINGQVRRDADGHFLTTTKRQKMHPRFYHTYHTCTRK